MKLRKNNPALILIDIQKGLDDEAYYGGNRNNKDAEKKAAHILHKWRELKLPIFHIQHSSPNPESRLHISRAGFAIKDEVKPISGEVLIVKNTNSAFIGTGLKERLNKEYINTVIIVGLTTNHCVSSSARMANNYGFETILISDATATFDRVGINGETYSSEIIHLTTLASLKDEFAEIMTAEELLGLV
ncbi:MAG TPA: cysteine hydrolase [Bacteroidetes bacterium]|nr:cysteine hydrolase [Bacteroidota bacterium]